MNLNRRSLFASALALLALPRKVAGDRLLGPMGRMRALSTNGFFVPSDRMGVVASVVEFGACGDGKTDDTAAINAAIAWAKANGAVVAFPSGTYLRHDA